MRSLSRKVCETASARNWGRGRRLYSHSRGQPQASVDGGGCQLVWEWVAAHHAILRFTAPLAPSYSAAAANQRQQFRDGTDSSYCFWQGHPSETSRAPHDFPAMYRYFCSRPQFLSSLQNAILLQLQLQLPAIAIATLSFPSVDAAPFTPSPKTLKQGHHFSPYHSQILFWFSL